jgi:ABC-type Fe3+/spermidine/putrescine transport system ATPase subunit
VYERPATRFVAEFIGRNNVIEATVSRVANDSVVLRFENGREVSIHPGQRAKGLDVTPGTRVSVCIRAESLQLTNGAGLFSGSVRDVEYSGSMRSCTVNTDAGELEIEVPSSTARPVPGQNVSLAFDPAAVHVVASV